MSGDAKVRRVLVTGGGGYIGSHAVRRLLQRGYEVTVVDDLSKGSIGAVERAAGGLGRAARFARSSISDRDRMSSLLVEHAIDAVLHFAAFIEVGESVADPLRYYRNNTSGALELLASVRDAGVGRFVFSSTAAVYGGPARVPIVEEEPRLPINPYGRSKLMAELMVQDFAAAYGLGCSILRYFNVAGADPEGWIGESHEPETHLIPRILEAAAGRGGEIGIYGTDYPTPDGTCVRDYVHVMDLVDAHLLAMEAIRPGEGRAYNLGSEKGFSVREVIRMCERVTGTRIRVREQPRRAGDPAVLVASSERIRNELGWSPQRASLDTIIADAWSWHRKRAAMEARRSA